MSFLNQVKDFFQSLITPTTNTSADLPTGNAAVGSKVIHVEYVKFKVSTTVDREIYSRVHFKTIVFGLNFVEFEDGSRKIDVDPGIVMNVPIGDTTAELSLKRHPVWTSLVSWATKQTNEIDIPQEDLEWVMHV